MKVNVQADIKPETILKARGLGSSNAATKVLDYCPEIRDAHLCLETVLTDGTKVRLVDYASAGKTWTDESRCAAWLYRKALES